MDFIRKNCNAKNNTFIQKVGNQTGLYCKECGKWIKWLNKNEVQCFTHKETNDNNLVERLEEFVKFLDETIDKEYENPASTANELIRKNSYCLALERDKNAIINILNGKRYYEYESEE